MTLQHEPQRLLSDDREHFREAYAKRPVLKLVVNFFYLVVVVAVISALWKLFTGHFLQAVTWLLVAAACFVVWFVVHNWALTHPKRFRAR